MRAMEKTLTVWVPLAIRQRGGRKQVLTPVLGASPVPGQQHAGEGAGAGISVAADVGKRGLWHDRGAGRG
jgi:hypothetical protein